MITERHLTPLSQEVGSAFRDYLDARYDLTPDYARDSRLWEPVVHDDEEYERLITIQRALQIGLKAVFAVMGTDERLRQLLGDRLSDETMELFSQLPALDVSQQFLRPDYLLDREKGPQICEINTRFILNGNIISAELTDFLSQRHALRAEDARQLDAFMHRTYDGDGRKVGFFAISEPEHDIMLQKQRTTMPIDVDTTSLKGLASQVKRLIIELHQHELDEVMNEVATEIKNGLTVLNDPRIVHVLHDKRLLVPLSDETYMKDLVGTEVAGILAASIIPSYHPSWQGRRPEDMPGKQVLAKGALSGKSNDQLLVKIPTYRDRLRDPSAYVYQPVLRQIPYKTPNGLYVNVAGTLPMTLGGEVFGPGLARISRHARMRTYVGMTVTGRATA